MNLNLLEQVNPVFNTAKMTVFQLASIGDKDAAEIVEKLNLTFEETQNSATSKTSPELMALNNIMLETRYGSALRIYAESKNVITKGYYILWLGSSRRDRRG